jgi:DedD protein
VAGAFEALRAKHLVMEDNDAQSQLKKRARRRLVGAVAFASVVAVVLPMVMDHQPRQAVTGS